MPANELSAHIKGLVAYLSAPEETANEDRAINYFRKISGDSFTRQKEASRADGYVPGLYVLELKGKTADWLSGFFQALAYKNRGLDFSQIVVAAKGFLALWRVDDLDEALKEEVWLSTGAPNTVGIKFAKKNKDKRNEILKQATWTAMELSGSLFLAQPALIVEKLQSFEKALREGRKVRQRVTPKNFTAILKEMKQFFDIQNPVKAVRAFYTMVYSWNENSTVQLSEKIPDQATLGGETITNLIPARRLKFKDFVENRCIFLTEEENVDDFFARYDEALDAVDKDFRIKHGIFFTDRDLSKFVMWLVKQWLAKENIPDLGKNYLVVDPASGSGNLVTNWRSPLQLRHKVISEIEPELLFAIDRRMKGDQWHNGKFTVVPKVSENKGLNFLDRSADDYLEEMRKYLEEKGQKPTRPLAFLCNPPYRSDEDTTASEINYKVHDSILEVTGADAGNERYCCFLAQMKLICDAAKANGLPDNSLLLVFTKSAWITKRAAFGPLRSHILGSFQHIAGILITSNEFFDVKGKWPVGFTVWRYKSKEPTLEADRSVPLLDLTWLTKKALAEIPWDQEEEREKSCTEIINDPRTIEVQLGKDRKTIREWSGQTMLDFKRDRRKEELNQPVVGGLPAGDLRHALKKAHGESTGQFIGFMDDLTPCRVKKSIPDRPWFRLNNQFMDIRKNRCLSGPPTNRGYCASDLESAKKLFFWYALARTFIQHPYPMWADADDMWEPVIPVQIAQRIFQSAFAIGYSENECVETRFPAHNPIVGAPELYVSNPMTPLNPSSFWSTTIRPYCGEAESETIGQLIGAVNTLFWEWKKRFKNSSELPVSRKPYSLDDEGVRVDAGIIQIVHYANETADQDLVRLYVEVQRLLKSVKGEFFNLIVNELAYFGTPKKPSASVILPAKPPGISELPKKQ